MTNTTRFEGELPDMHDQNIRACIVRITPIGGSPNPGIRDVVAYFDSTQNAEAAAAAMTAASVATAIPGTTFKVFDPRRTHA